MYERKTTRQQFDAMAEALDKTRKTSKTIVVDREAFANLFIDHGKLSTIARVYNALKGE